MSWAALQLTVVVALVAASAETQTSALQRRFNQFDRNGDGKITAEELGMPTVFKAADGNGDGTIFLEEFTAYMSKRRGKKGNTTPGSSLSAEIVKHADVRYAETPGVEANAQSLDIYAPKNAKNAPVMMYVHGGGWRRGDKQSRGAAPGFFNGQGFIFVSINYRLLPAGQHPNNVADVARAINWVHDHIARYGGDPSQLFLYGHSAGAHLVALVATDERHLKAAGKRLAVLKAVIPLDTNAYDIPKLTAAKGAHNLYAQTFGPDPVVQKDASPIAHIAPGKGIPPMLVFHSNSGTGSRNEQGNAFVAALKAAGVDAELIPSMKQDHGEINRQFGTPGDMVTEAAMNFINRIRGNTTSERSAANAKPPAAPLSTGRSKQTDAIQARSRPRPDASTSSASNVPSALTLQFVKDYFPGTVDVVGRPLAGTEMMNFAVHGGRLYAGLGNRNLPDDASVKVGAQVIVKDSANTAWRVEHQFESTAPRVNAMISAVFTTDALGRSLEPAVAVLVAAPSDATSYENTASGHEPLRWATAWTRNDATGNWTKARVYSAERRKPACRSFGVYRDPVTRVCHLFAGTSHGSIHRAVYDPTAPGHLVWNESAELDNVGRVVAFAECNGVLYAACGLRRTREGITGGLYRRRNGTRAHWECVYRWPWPARRGGADEAFLMRGLTAVPAPDGDGEVLLGSRAQPGVIERIDPRAEYAVTVELDLREHFARVWTLPDYRRAALSAYNTMAPWTDPKSGEQVHLIGVAVLHPKLADTPPHNGAWYLVRHSAGHYSTGYIHDSEHPVSSGTNLRGTRAMVASPFDKTTVFAGGGDIGKQISLNTAWIYRSKLSECGE